MIASEEIEKKSFVEILFEGRNKKYGAYEIRHAYYRNLIIGLIFSTSILVAGLLMPYLINLINFERSLSEETQIVDVNLLPPPPGPINLDEIPKQEKPVKEEAPVVSNDSIPEKKEKHPKKPKEKEKLETTDSEKGDETTGGGGEGTGDNKEFYLHVDKIAQPPYNWNEYLSRNLHYPEVDKKMNVQGKVMIMVRFNADGSVHSAEISQGVSATINAEALRIIKNMPKWNPAKRGGETVPMLIVIPINFTLKR